MDLDMTPIDTAALKEKYKISPPQLQKWLSVCGIKSWQEGRKFYVYAYQVELLDKLAMHMQTPGALLKDFKPTLESNGLLKETTSLSVVETVAAVDLAKWVELVTATAKTKELLERLNALEEIATRGYICTSKELAMLLGIKRMPSSGYSSRGYEFQRKGRWWVVRKLSRD